MSDVRLIDANSFKRFLQALCKAGAPYDDVIQLLDKEPTFYNPEKVVEFVRVDCYSMGFDESQAEIIVEDIRKGGIDE